MRNSKTSSFSLSKEEETYNTLKKQLSELKESLKHEDEVIGSEVKRKEEEL
jgi:hypothetical protein